MNSHFIGSAVYIPETNVDNVEVRLEKHEDLTYVLGLVRQAPEKQLGEEE